MEEKLMSIGVIVRGDDPIQSLDILGRYVIGVHCKDGKRSGREGDVGIERFINKLKEIGYTGP